MFRVAPFCVWIAPELFGYFSIRRRVSRKLNMKINFLWAAHIFIFYYETFIVKTDFKFIIGVSAE